MKRAEQHLKAADPKLAAIIESTPRPRPVRTRDLYLALLQSVASQQLSGKAADTIFGRFIDLFSDGYPQPDLVVNMSDADIRSAGFSRQKATYIRNIADYALSRGMDYDQFNVLEDAEVIRQLTEIKGVGRWTVEMLLMFPMNRQDVLPVDDLGIQQAMTALYRLRSRGPALKRRMERLARPWRPYRSLACRYLWKWKSGM